MPKKIRIEEREIYYAYLRSLNRRGWRDIRPLETRRRLIIWLPMSLDMCLAELDRLRVTLDSM